MAMKFGIDGPGDQLQRDKPRRRLVKGDQKILNQ